jgi:hypothetical protein
VAKLAPAVRRRNRMPTAIPALLEPPTIHGAPSDTRRFLAAVRKVRIHLPPAVSPYNPAPPLWVSSQSHLRSVPNPPLNYGDARFHRRPFWCAFRAYWSVNRNTGNSGIHGEQETGRQLPRASPISTGAIQFLRRTRSGVDVRRGGGRIGRQPGGGLTLQSGCPDGSAFQNMILSK